MYTGIDTYKFVISLKIPKLLLLSSFRRVSRNFTVNWSAFDLVISNLSLFICWGNKPKLVNVLDGIGSSMVLSNACVLLFGSSCGPLIKFIIIWRPKILQLKRTPRVLRVMFSTTQNCLRPTGQIAVKQGTKMKPVCSFYFVNDDSCCYCWKTTLCRNEDDLWLEVGVHFVEISPHCPGFFKIKNDFYIFVDNNLCWVLSQPINFIIDTWCCIFQLFI